MAQQRQRQGGFRFSLPWMATQTTPPQLPAGEARSSRAQRQPPRVSPSQNSNQQLTPPPRAQPSNDIETQKPSPSRADTQSRVINSQLSSPSRIGTQSQNNTKILAQNQPPSPLRINSQNRVTTPKSTPQTVSKPKSPPKINPHSTPISNENEKYLIESKLEVEGKEDEDEKSQEATQGKEIMQEHSDNDKYSKDTHSTLAKGSKEPISSNENLASDEEQTHVAEEDNVGIKETLNPKRFTNEYPKSVLSDHADKDGARVSHHKSESSVSHKGIKDDISKLVHKMTNEHQKLSLDEGKISVITLTGENRGATMTIGRELAQKEEKIRIYRGYKVNPHESDDSTTEGEKSSNEESTKGSERQDDEETNSYINSNIQTVNNSIMFNSSMTENNPGVHFTMSRNVMEHIEETKSEDPLEVPKTKFSVAKSQNLRYKPVVRRRCLKGLLMESSDSDPENPDKPRRHGCRACGEKSSENK